MYDLLRGGLGEGGILLFYTGALESDTFQFSNESIAGFLCFNLKLLILDFYKAVRMLRIL